MSSFISHSTRPAVQLGLSGVVGSLQNADAIFQLEALRVQNYIEVFLTPFTYLTMLTNPLQKFWIQIQIQLTTKNKTSSAEELSTDCQGCHVFDHVDAETKKIKLPSI